MIPIILRCLLLQSTIASASSSSSSSASHQQQNGGRHESIQASLEAARYSTLPPTVFAPGGRLHGVERVAKEAMLLDAEADVASDDVSCGVLALHCVGNDREGEFAVMVGIGATSPYLHRDEAYLDLDYPTQRQEEEQQVDDPIQNDDVVFSDHHDVIGQTYLPLTINEEAASSTTSSITTPLSILSPTLIVGTGGKAIDSTILLRRTTEVALSMYSNDNGGVDWFVSHSLEGTYEDGGGSSTNNGNGDLWRSVAGGAAGVDATSLVRRVADMAQSSTQSLGGRYGRMLSSSLLAVGTHGLINNSNNSKSDHNANKLILWRVDPTGQFWRSNASAVGRGAANAESELLHRVQRWRTAQQQNKEQQQNNNEDESELCDIQQEDVQSYLASLSANEAVEVATDCLVKGIMERRRKQLANNTKDDDIIVKQMELGLRKIVQAVVIRSNRSIDVVGTSSSESQIEIF